MRDFTVVVEQDADTGLYVGYVPGWPGAHAQGATLDELRENLEEVVAMLLKDLMSAAIRSHLDRQATAVSSPRGWRSVFGKARAEVVEAIDTGRAAAPRLEDELAAIGQRCSALPVLDPRGAEEILGYDERGLPR